MKRGCGIVGGVVVVIAAIGMVAGAFGFNTSTSDPSPRATTQTTTTRAATPRVTQEVTARSTPRATVAPISLDGSGTATRNITLAEGLWTVAYSVKDNLDGGRGTNFIIEIEAVVGGSELIANEIGVVFNGTTTMRVSDGLFGLSPGKAIVSVDAAARGKWTVTLTRE